MDNSEQMQFAATIAEVQDLLARSLAMVQRAKLKCHGELFEHVSDEEYLGPLATE